MRVRVPLAAVEANSSSWFHERADANEEYHISVVQPVNKGLMMFRSGVCVCDVNNRTRVLSAESRVRAGTRQVLTSNPRILL